MMLTRLPVVQVMRHILPWPARATNNMTRGLIEAVVMTEAGPLRLLNTHLEYSHPEIRAAQVEAIRRIHAEACARTVTPRNDSWGTYKFTPSATSAILMGDFNMKPDDPLLTRLAAPFEMARPPSATPGGSSTVRSPIRSRPASSTRASRRPIAATTSTRPRTRAAHPQHRLRRGHARLGPSASPHGARMTVRIAQISDLHASPEKPVFNANMHRLMEAVRETRPDILLNTGDLGLFGERDNGDIALALAAQKTLASRAIWCRAITMSVSIPDIPGRVWVDEASLGRYRRQAGADFWTLDLPGWRLIALDSLIVGTGLSGDGEQMEMLRKASHDRQGRSVALIMHKPLMDLSYDDPLVSNRFTTLRCRRLILDAIGEKPADLVICGHVHQYRDIEVGGSRHIWGPPPPS